jgi:hypothetical protein
MESSREIELRPDYYIVLVHSNKIHVVLKELMFLRHFYEDHSRLVAATFNFQFRGA